MGKSIIEKELDAFSEEIKANEIKSKVVKKRFIEELKNGLGEKIKNNPNEVIFLDSKKITFKQKIINFFKKF